MKIKKRYTKVCLFFCIKGVKILDTIKNIKNIGDVLIWVVAVFQVLMIIFNYIKQPIIKSGLFDYPSSHQAHYFVIVKNFLAVNKNNPVSCVISSKLNLRGYKIKVVKWYVRAGFEHVDEVFIKLNNEDPHKIIFSFELPSNQKYRIIIESDAEYIGALSGPYDLSIALD